MIEVSNISASLDSVLPGRELELSKAAAIACNVGLDDIVSVELAKRSVDARKKSFVHFVVTLRVELVDAELEKLVLEQGSPVPGVGISPHVPYAQQPIPDLSALADEPLFRRPVVVGTGPAGLFAALYLAHAGLRPLVVERGCSVEERARIVDEFFRGGPLDASTNVQFGEGGAGTFSDGKLTTNTKNPFTKQVLHWFVEAGAPEDILYLAKPHIGTDKLRLVVRNLRERIEQFGGEVRFRTQLVGLDLDQGAASGVRLLNLDTQEERLVEASAVILACGHSARDVFEMIRDAGFVMERKPFSMGVRIEHLQQDINRGQYGEFAGHPALGAADYKLVVHLDGGRSVYTFCMCPGGSVVPAASEEGGLCVNGMSNHARDGENANAALLVNVDPSDFPDEDDVLSGVRLQRAYERAAFELGRAASNGDGGDYRAPAQTVGDFLAGRHGIPSRKVKPTYARGVAWADLHRCLPDFVSASLAAAFPLLDRKLKGFADPEAVLTGVETRSSSPVRIVRDASFQAVIPGSPNDTGLYPCGEGPGYAGGIMSAAVDGLRVAQALCSDLQAKSVAQALRAGSCALFPTDTVFGLGLSVRDAASPRPLFELKGRAGNKPVAWLVRGLDDLAAYGRDLPAWVLTLAREFWPGALTLIVNASPGAPPAFVSAAGTVGMRMPRSRQALALLDAVGCPLATTSANKSGEPSVKSLADVCGDLRDRVPFQVVESGPSSGVSSTVVDCTGAQPVVVRVGGVSPEEISLIYLKAKNQDG